MLTDNNYNKSLKILEQMKYNINYDKSHLFEIVCSSMANKLLNHEYNDDLTEHQRDVLQQIANK